MEGCVILNGVKNLMQNQYYAYIITNSNNRVLYTGITGNLKQRIYQHKSKLIEGFTTKYNVDKLVWYEVFDTAEEAIGAEKKIKGWLRKKKVALVEENNPNWKDMSNDF